MALIGIDEVGRGCWAGPLVAGAVSLSSNFNLEDCPPVLRDSKKMSAKQRRQAAIWIHANATAVGLGWVWAVEIDEYGLSWAVKTAMERALAEVKAEYDQLIIDGIINYFPDNAKAKAIIKADDSVPAVSAASIVAKVARDDYMTSLPQAYIGYGFEKHVGYGTVAHIAALKLHGVSDLHRKSYKPIQALL